MKTRGGGGPSGRGTADTLRKSGDVTALSAQFWKAIQDGDAETATKVCHTLEDRIVVVKENQHEEILALRKEGKYGLPVGADATEGYVDHFNKDKMVSLTVVDGDTCRASMDLESGREDFRACSNSTISVDMNYCTLTVHARDASQPRARHCFSVEEESVGAYFVIEGPVSSPGVQRKWIFTKPFLPVTSLPSDWMSLALDEILKSIKAFPRVLAFLLRRYPSDIKALGDLEGKVEREDLSGELERNYETVITSPRGQEPVLQDDIFANPDSEEPGFKFTFGDDDEAEEDEDQTPNLDDFDEDEINENVDAMRTGEAKTLLKFVLKEVKGMSAKQREQDRALQERLDAIEMAHRERIEELQQEIQSLKQQLSAQGGNTISAHAKRALLRSVGEEVSTTMKAILRDYPLKDDLPPALAQQLADLNHAVFDPDGDVHQALVRILKLESKKSGLGRNIGGVQFKDDETIENFMTLLKAQGLKSPAMLLWDMKRMVETLGAGNLNEDEIVNKEDKARKAGYSCYADQQACTTYRTKFPGSMFKKRAGTDDFAFTGFFTSRNKWEGTLDNSPAKNALEEIQTILERGQLLIDKRAPASSSVFADLHQVAIWLIVSAHRHASSFFNSMIPLVKLFVSCKYDEDEAWEQVQEFAIRIFEEIYKKRNKSDQMTDGEKLIGCYEATLLAEEYSKANWIHHSNTLSTLTAMALKQSATDHAKLKNVIAKIEDERLGLKRINVRLDSQEGIVKKVEKFINKQGAGKGAGNKNE